MSYKYGTNGYDLNWDAVICLNEICLDCEAYIFEQEKIASKYQEECLKEDCAFDRELEHICENHTLVYYPGESLDIQKMLKAGKKLEDCLPWFIVHDTNTNFVGTFGNVPDKYFTDEYLEEKYSLSMGRD